MKIILIRGDERVEIEGDDALIHESLCYQFTWERRVSEVVKAFYSPVEGVAGTAEEVTP